MEILEAYQETGYKPGLCLANLEGSIYWVRIMDKKLLFIEISNSP